MSLLGQTLGELGKYDEAERLLLAAYEGVHENPAAAASSRARCLERIVHLYEARGMTDEAASWRAKAEAAAKPVKAGAP